MNGLLTLVQDLVQIYLNSRILDFLCHFKLPGITRVQRNVEPALTNRGNRIVATGGDRLYRRMVVLTPQGRQEVDLRGSRVASLVARHHDAVRSYIRTGDITPLAWFRGKRVGGVELATDPKDLETAAIRGDLDVDDIYPDR